MHLRHHQILRQVELSVDVGGEDVLAIIDPDQIVNAIAADPALTKGVDGALGGRVLGIDER